jgi:ADP-ribosylglycohydrolase
LKKEQGAKTDPVAKAFSREIANVCRRVRRLPIDQKLDAAEPNDLQRIRGLRPRGPRVLALDLTKKELEDRMLGAWLGRAAGCILGIPCEGMTRQHIQSTCHVIGQPYPMDRYWISDPRHQDIEARRHYGMTRRLHFIGKGIDRVGTDDDLTYTLLGLLILEEFGLDFTSEDVGKAWLKYLPIACTAEHVALENLKAGLEPPRTALKNNPYCEWIGADIRSDPWGYASAGLPERAAELAWRDARVSHIKNGIYGEMFFSAVIAAAFATGDVRKAIRIGLTEIPKGCRLQKDMKKVLRWCHEDREWGKTVDRIYQYFTGMHGVHTNNNAALTLAGLLYGEGSFEKTICLTVMGGFDTDCTGATAGSIAGAAMGAAKLPSKWIRCLGNRVESYIIGKPRWSSSGVAKRFTKLALGNREALGC